ncbi:uncharacterized protein LOC144627279 [Crassostrea virginica]
MHYAYRKLCSFSFMHVQCHLYMYMYTACLPIILCFGFENWYSVYWKEGPHVHRELLKEVKEKVEILEEKYKKKLEENGVQNGKFLRRHGDPGEAIVSVAEKEKATFIVTGCRGMGLLRRTFMGSVSDYVMHHAHCPVLVCRK